MSAPDPPGRYRLSYSRELATEIARLGRRAPDNEVRRQFSETLRVIWQSLERDPHGWGDPTQTLRDMRAKVYYRVIDRLRVSYAVHDDPDYVWLQEITPVLDSPLTGEG